MGEDNIDEISELYKKYVYPNEEHTSTEHIAAGEEPEQNINPLELYITAEDYFSNTNQVISEKAKNKFMHFKTLAEQGDPRLYLQMLVSCSE